MLNEKSTALQEFRKAEKELENWRVRAWLIEMLTVILFGSQATMKAYVFI